MIEFLTAKVEEKYQESGRLFYGEEVQLGKPRRERPLELDRELLALMVRGYDAQENKRDTLSQAFFRTAGNRAVRLFDRIPEASITPYERRTRIAYGELAVIALREAGETPRAEEFARRFVEDRMVREEPRRRVLRMTAPVTPPKP